MKVLHLTSELDGGGVDSVLFNYCSRMMPHVQSDFIVSSEKEGILEGPLRDMGSRVFHVAKMRENLKLRQSQLRKILMNGQYDAVHDHSGYKGFFFLNLARQMGVNCRIAHSHIAAISESDKSAFERALITPLTELAATHLFACGMDAARWMWGKPAVKRGRVTIMPNAIDTNKFKFSEDERYKIKAQMGLDEKFVIGNVARLSDQKNHKYLFEIFSRILVKRPNATLLLIGRGELQNELKEQAASLGIDQAVMFLGIRDDVYRLLNAMDVFVLPSKYEGLPVTLVEAQANGIPIVVSDTVTDEIRLASNYEVLSLCDSPDNWADCIIALHGHRQVDVSKIIEKYDINVLAKKQMEWYLLHEN